MKQGLNITAYKKILQQLLFSAVLIITVLTPGRLLAQTDSTQQKAPAVENETSLISPSVELISIQKSDNTIDLGVALKAKVNTVFIKLPLLKVTFLQVNDDGEKVFGFAITDRNGKAVFNVKADSLKADKEGKLHFKAVFAGNKAMDPADAEVLVKRARIEVTPVKEDSLLTVKVKLIDMGTGTDTPVPEVIIGIYVHRMFYPLKVGEGTTDANGEATIEIPKNLPGDAKGDLTLMAKLDENEIYGNLQSTVVQQWGTPVSDKLHELPRALWSAHPPVWMMVTFVVLMGTVWGHYLVIIVQLFRLRKEEPDPDSPTVETIY